MSSIFRLTWTLALFTFTLATWAWAWAWAGAAWTWSTRSTARSTTWAANHGHWHHAHATTAARSATAHRATWASTTWTTGASTTGASTRGALWRWFWVRFWFRFWCWVCNWLRESDGYRLKCNNLFEKDWVFCTTKKSWVQNASKLWINLQSMQRERRVTNWISFWLIFFFDCFTIAIVKLGSSNADWCLWLKFLSHLFKKKVTKKIRNGCEISVWQ